MCCAYMPSKSEEDSRKALRFIGIFTYKHTQIVSHHIDASYDLIPKFIEAEELIFQNITLSFSSFLFSSFLLLVAAAAAARFFSLFIVFVEQERAWFFPNMLMLVISYTFICSTDSIAGIFSARSRIAQCLWFCININLGHMLFEFSKHKQSEQKFILLTFTKYTHDICVMSVVMVSLCARNNGSHFSEMHKT